MLPTITLIHMSVIPVLAGAGRSSSSAARTRRSTRAASSPAPAARPCNASGTTTLDDLERLLQEEVAQPRLICIDGVNSMTGNAPDLAQFARLAREYDALLYVDDAHGFGVIGERSDDEPSPYGIARNSIVTLLRRELRPRRARRRSLEVVLVARGLPRLPARAQAAC